MQEYQLPKFEIFGNNEEAAQGSASSCRATRRAKATDPRRLWILEEVGCRLQEGVPLCSSGTAQEKHLQKNSDSGKLWSEEGIGRSRQEDEPHYKIGTMQRTRASGAQS
jgi:hypothetical protein